MASARSQDPLELLPLVFARPDQARADAEALLARSPGPFEASIAHQVIGILERDFGDATAAVARLRTARRLAHRSGSADREADVLATLGIALVHAGRTRQGLDSLARGLSAAEGVTAARVRFRRAAILWVLGRHAEGLDDLRRAIPVLRRADDTIWTARALTLRGTIRLATGAAAQADLDFVAAEALWTTTDQDHDVAVAVENRGLVAARSGDIPAALTHFDEAARRYEALGTPMNVLHAERSGVLMAAGLAREALAEAEVAVGMLERSGGQATRRAELLLTAARAALSAGALDVASRRAAAAARLFARQHRDWWEAHARLVLYQVRFASGHVSRTLLRNLSTTAATLRELGASEATAAALLAGRVALAVGAEAGPFLDTAARARLSGPAAARADGWLARALSAEAAGRPRAVLEACRRGLDVLDEHRLTLGAAELRARTTARGAELAVLAQRECLDSPRRLLVWSERWRATALAIPPTRPPEDLALLQDLTAFRELHSRLEAAGERGPALERELRRLERRIRDRTHRISGDGRTGARRFDPAELLDRLGGDRLLIEITEVDGDAHVLLCGRGRVRQFTAGRIEDAIAELAHVRAGLHRLSYGGSPGRLAVLRAGGARLQELLLGPAAARLGAGPVVVVPPGRLHGVPWAVLPALEDRVLSVSPSAGAWLRAGSVRPPDGDAVLVRGPGLASGGAEVPLLAGAYPRRALLEDGAATAAAVLKAIDGSALAHVAAHGTFRSDNPMFSALRMDDGPLTVYDLERLHRAPYRLVLPCCDSGRLEHVGADELLGLASAVLPLGTAGIVAALLPVNDAAVVPLMLAFHDALRAGRSMAEALHDARRSLPPGPLHQATGASFAVIGAG